MNGGWKLEAGSWKRFLILFTLLFFIYNLPSYSQDLKYAHKIIDTLCSPSMHGRGYANNGDKIAAKYIKDQFEGFKLKNFESGFYQGFHLSVNTFPETPRVSIDGKELIPGKDFIFNEKSGSSNGCFDLLFINNQIVYDSLAYVLGNSFDKYACVLNESFLKGMTKHPVIIILNKKKLTQDIGSELIPMACIQVYDSLIPKNAKKIKIKAVNRYVKNYQTQNIISYIKGSQYPDSFMVYSAHYDHLGQMGKDVYFPGANDNASGCAMLLNLAKYYSEHPPKYSVAFMAFGAEEAGLLGSKYYTEHPLFPLKQIKFLVNLDLVGTGDEGITVVNGAVLKNEFDALVKINEEKKYLKLVKPRAKAMNSDHYFFTEAGVKSFFIYTMGGIKAYHDIYDRPETLPLTEFEDLFKLLVDFTDQITK